MVCNGGKLAQTVRDDGGGSHSTETGDHSEELSPGDRTLHLADALQASSGFSGSLESNYSGNCN